AGDRRLHRSDRCRRGSHAMTVSPDNASQNGSTPSRAGATATHSPLLELSDVHACYGRIKVLHGVDLVVPRGQVVALLGPNGAGKTTALKVATGQHPIESGCVHIAGRHVN